MEAYILLFLELLVFDTRLVLLDTDNSLDPLVRREEASVGRAVWEPNTAFFQPSRCDINQVADSQEAHSYDKRNQARDQHKPATM